MPRVNSPFFSSLDSSPCLSPSAQYCRPFVISIKGHCRTRRRQRKTANEPIVISGAQHRGGKESEAGELLTNTKEEKKTKTPTL